MARSAAFIGATLGFALVLGACSTEILGKPPALGTGTGGTTGHPSGTGDGGMSTSGQGGASSGGGGNGGGGDIGGSTGNVGDGGSGGGGLIGGTGTGGGGTIPEGYPCMMDGDCAGMQHFCLRSACDAPMGVCAAMPSEASCGAPACSANDPPCVPPSSDGDAVCGCDHVTYANSCDAQAHGVSIDFNGACALPSLPASCSSVADCVPDGGSPASYTKVLACVASYCGSPFGTCVLIGQACLSTLPTDGRDTSVCSCSFTTFSDVCVARAQGADVPQPDAGACPTTAP